LSLAVLFEIYLESVILMLILCIRDDVRKRIFI